MGKSGKISSIRVKSHPEPCRGLGQLQGIFRFFLDLKEIFWRPTHIASYGIPWSFSSEISFSSLISFSSFSFSSSFWTRVFGELGYEKKGEWGNYNILGSRLGFSFLLPDQYWGELGEDHGRDQRDSTQKPAPKIQTL